MLKIKKSTESEGRWFQYAEGVEFKIRPLSGNILRELRKSTSTVRMCPDSKSGRLVQVNDVNEEKFDEAVTDYILEDFKGVGDDKGNLFELTLENKKLIMDQLPLRDFIWSAAQSLDVGEEQIKN